MKLVLIYMYAGSPPAQVLIYISLKIIIDVQVKYKRNKK